MSEEIAKQLLMESAENLRDSSLGTYFESDIHTLAQSYLTLLEHNRELASTLVKVKEHCSMDDPDFGNFTPLQFAARLGLIYQESEKALSTTSQGSAGEKPDGKKAAALIEKWANEPGDHDEQIVKELEEK